MEGVLVAPCTTCGTTTRTAVGREQAELERWWEKAGHKPTAVAAAEGAGTPVDQDGDTPMTERSGELDDPRSRPEAIKRRLDGVARALRSYRRTRSETRLSTPTAS